jgi:hypothetical protein
MGYCGIVKDDKCDGRRTWCAHYNQALVEWKGGGNRASSYRATKCASFHHKPYRLCRQIQLTCEGLIEMSGKLTLVYDRNEIKIWEHEDGEDVMYFLIVKGGGQVVLTDEGFHKLVIDLAHIGPGIVY